MSNYHGRELVVSHLVGRFRVAVVFLNHCVSLGENSLAECILVSRVVSEIQIDLKMTIINK